jgi:hypothetical protein
MCGACGILESGTDWIDGFGREDVPHHVRLGERRRRLQLINAMLEGTGVRLHDYGRKMVVRSATGATRIVRDLAHVWRAADEIGRRPADPLSIPQASRAWNEP